MFMNLQISHLSCPEVIRFHGHFEGKLIPLRSSLVPRLISSFCAREEEISLGTRVGRKGISLPSKWP